MSELFKETIKGIKEDAEFRHHIARFLMAEQSIEIMTKYLLKEDIKEKSTTCGVAKVLLAKIENKYRTTLD